MDTWSLDVLESRELLAALPVTGYGPAGTVESSPPARRARAVAAAVPKLTGVWDGRAASRGDPAPTTLRLEITRQNGRTFKGTLDLIEPAVVLTVRGAVNGDQVEGETKGIAELSGLRGTFSGRLTSKHRLEGKVRLTVDGERFSAAMELERRREDRDDQISEARHLGRLLQPAVVHDRAETLTDVDVYSFDVLSGQDVTISLAAAGDFRPRLLVQYAPSLRPEGVASETQGQVSYRLRSTFAGRYYVAVGHALNYGIDLATGEGDSVGGRGRYTLSILTGGEDPDDQMIEAKSLGAITADRAITGRLDGGGRDVDMFSFGVQEGQAVRFSLQTAAGVKTKLGLMRPDGGVFTESGDVDPMAPGAQDPVLDFSVFVSGIYYVIVSHGGNRFYDPFTGQNDRAVSPRPPRTQYTLRIEPIDPATAG